MDDVFLINDIAPARLEAERSRVLELICSIVPAEYVFEVGSTAVEGVVGKQDLDFLVRVRSTEFESTRDRLDQLFTRNSAQISSQIYQGYLVSSDLDVAIQLTVENGPQDTFLQFLNLLRDSEVLREQYNQLKRSFNGQPMEQYRDAKRAFIEKAISND